MPRVQLQYPGNTFCSHETVVRINDLSPAAHIGFDKIVNILFDASATFLRKIKDEDKKDQLFQIIYSDLSVQYKSEAFRGDRLLIHMAVGEISSKGFELYFNVTSPKRNNEVALARIGMVLFDYSKQCTMKIPQTLREKIS